jgi:hypothetical protein
MLKQQFFKIIKITLLALSLVASFALVDTSFSADDSTRTTEIAVHRIDANQEADPIWYALLDVTDVDATTRASFASDPSAAARFYSEHATDSDIVVDKQKVIGNFAYFKGISEADRNSKTYLLFEIENRVSPTNYTLPMLINASTINDTNEPNANTDYVTVEPKRLDPLGQAKLTKVIASNNPENATRLAGAKFKIFSYPDGFDFTGWTHDDYVDPSEKDTNNSIKEIDATQSLATSGEVIFNGLDYQHDDNAFTPQGQTYKETNYYIVEESALITADADFKLNTDVRTFKLSSANQTYGFDPIAYFENEEEPTIKGHAYFRKMIYQGASASVFDGPLEGAKFELWIDNGTPGVSNDDVQLTDKTVLSTANGTFEFEVDLGRPSEFSINTPKNFYIKEVATDATTHYLIDSNPITFSFTPGNLLVGAPDRIVIGNKPEKIEGSAHFAKIDGNNNGLSGATFSLWSTSQANYDAATDNNTATVPTDTGTRVDINGDEDGYGVEPSATGTGAFSFT